MQGRSDPRRELCDVESLAGHLLPTGGVFAFLAAHRHDLFPDQLFVDLFAPGRGRPSVPVEVVASVIVLQTLHGLSDREATEALTFDLRWKAACGLAVTDPGFHPTTLTYWRRRLSRSERPNRIFDAVKTVVAETAVLRGKVRRVLDSTVLDDAVATQDTVTQLIAAVRRVARGVPGAAAVIAEHTLAHDYSDPGKPRIAWDDAAARAQLVDGLVGDAHRVLGVGIDLLTTSDIHNDTSGDTSSDTGFEVLTDSAYGTGDALAALAAAGHRPVIKPWPLRAAVQGGFTLDDFTVDEQAGSASCPNGVTRPITPTRNVIFGAACRGCPLRSRCTTSKTGRSLTLHPHDALQRAHRSRATDPDFQTAYRRHRPMVERSIAWLVAGGNRRLRFRGTRPNNLWLHHRVAGLNLRRLLTLGLHRNESTWAIA